ncbi:MAG TPA: hypothetical protein VNT76_10170, partial [Candidatus Binatus sp.]|nr:hypothetical protein [Candidatus Binatus sp.]
KARTGNSPKQTADIDRDYRVQVVYFVPTDRKPTANYEAKIRVVVSIISEVFTGALRARGHKSEGPKFEEQDGEVVVNLLLAEKPASAYSDFSKFNSERQFEAISDEIDRRFHDTRDQIVLVFAETYDEGPADKVWPGHVAKAAAKPPNGGVGIFSAWILRDEFCLTNVAAQKRLFADMTPIRGRRAIGNPAMNSPRVDFLEDGIGGVLHELAHAFGLPHDFREPRTEIMAQGFRSLRYSVGSSAGIGPKPGFSVDNANLAMSSRYLNATIDRADNQHPKATVDLQVVAKRSWTAKVEASDEKALRMIVFLDLSGDDRRMITGKMLTGKSQTITQPLPPNLLQSADAEIQVIVVDNGGNYAKI